MDFQNFAVNLVTANNKDLLDNTKKVLEAARSKSISVIHITYELPPENFPPTPNKAIQNVQKLFGGYKRDDPIWTIHESLKPLPTGKTCYVWNSESRPKLKIILEINEDL
jgi:nicotinamidase-related amidase